MGKLADALRAKYGNQKTAVTALGLDDALLERSEDMGKLSPATARAVVDALKRRGMLATDASPEEATRALENVEGEEGKDADPNAGVPAFMREEPDDAEDAFETAEERKEDEGCDRRARDARMRLGRDETEEEAERREEEEGKEADDKAARDAMRMRRTADARMRLGRDETEEEREKRERDEGAEDRVRARDRRRVARDYLKARDAHRSARDAHRRHAADWRRARDAHKAAMDGSKADDAAKAARDMKGAADACLVARDVMVRARDARMRARDARRSLDRHMADRHMNDRHMDDKKADDSISKAAMDAAIAAAVRDNDLRHREIADARGYVRPKVGELAMDGSINSAADVYDRALTILGVDHAGIREPVALKRLFELAPRPGGERQSSNSGFALDATPASAVEGFRKRYPGAADIESF